MKKVLKIAGLKLLYLANGFLSFGVLLLAVFVIPLAWFFTTDTMDEMLDTVVDRIVDQQESILIKINEIS